MAHIPGVKNRTPDTLSRHPTGDQNPPKMVLHDDIHGIQDCTTAPTLHIPTQLMAGICTEDQLYSLEVEQELQESFISSLHSTHTVNWEEVQIATSSDEHMLLLLSTIEDGIPEQRHQLPAAIREYHQFRKHLYSTDGVIIYKDRIVIPPSLRPACLSALHAAHQGTSAMTSKAEASIFWPGITSDIQATRANCSQCNRMAPSQAALPPTSPMLSVYPFQCICADYFHYQGCNYIVIIDRYSIVERAKDGATGLINVPFATYGIPDELSSDGGPEFIAHTTRQFLHTWGVHHRLSSVAYPHSNCRAEVGVKTIKRLITGNVGKDGAINIDAFQQAILQYRNTPDPATKLSPAMCIFGRPTKDLIPILPGKYRPQSTWRESLNLREEALRKRHMIQRSEHTRPLAPLRVGDTVRIQNQTGHHPTKWDRTGIVIEVRQFHQYLIRIDGSGRQTIRNRKFVRKITPVHPPPVHRSILDDLPRIPFPTTTSPPSPPSDETPPGTAEDLATPADPNPPGTPADPTPPGEPPSPEPPIPLSPIPPIAPLRRSTRVKKPRTWLY